MNVFPNDPETWPAPESMEWTNVGHSSKTYRYNREEKKWKEVDGGNPWQPISTAPKDGTVDLWTPTQGRVPDCTLYDQFNPPKWIGEYKNPINPTHWIPIPPDPQ